MREKRFFIFITFAIVILTLIIGCAASANIDGADIFADVLVGDNVPLSPPTADATVVAAFVLAISATVSIIISRNRK